ncbi:hypothetical protein A2U01_0109409, partial [Trifolium medium]|nr:hypothetical protein [Trifolium medium]
HISEPEVRRFRVRTSSSFRGWKASEAGELQKLKTSELLKTFRG